MIKKYHLCDLFTLLEVILACTLTVMTFKCIPPDYALWVFVAGELCDAVDGPCARRWHYPDDGKRRWWRKYNKQIDQVSDILLACACALYIILCVSSFIGVILSATIAFIALVVQDIVYGQDSQIIFTRPKLAKRLVLFRRCVYVFLGIGGAIATLLWYTSWPILIKVCLSIVGIAAGAVVTLLKFKNRLSEIDTPL